MLVILFISLIMTLIYWFKYKQSLSKITWLTKVDNDTLDSYRDYLNQEISEKKCLVSVVIPAYNEAENIEQCVRAVLNSTKLPSSVIEIWVVDDQSTDTTLEIVKFLQQELKDPRLNILTGKTRPEQEKWIGKTWACHQGAEKTKGEFILFIDADIRLETGVIETSIYHAKQTKVDFLSLAPSIICKNWAEWLVQPLIFNHFNLIGDFQKVNDPQSEDVIVSGQFMLFTRSCYERLGGFRVVADQVVEDLMIGKLIKYKGMKLLLLSAPELLSVRMYSSWVALWEGWTKNFYESMQRQLWLAISDIVVMLIIFVIPWIGLIVFLIKVLNNVNTNLDYLGFVLIIGIITVQYDIRRLGDKYLKIPKDYWWLSGMGAMLYVLIVLGSIIKIKTGWGWTWRGRSLVK